MVSLDVLDAAFGRAVDRHMTSDVPVGLLLSSGVDSALVLERLAAQGRAPVCFTIEIAGAGDYDESEGARALAARFGAEHHVEMLDVGFAAAVEGVARAFDGPFADASAIATLSVARLASQHVKVVLSGTGGDDLFGGYYRHRAHHLQWLARIVPASVARRLAARQADRGAERRALKSLFASYAVRLARARDGTAGDQYLSIVGSSTSSAAIDVLRRPVELPEVRRAVAARLGLRDAPAARWMSELIAFECRTYLPYDLLVKEDRATMAHGVESRVPLLDVELAALAELMPERQLASLLTGKKPLHDLYERRIGPRTRVKRGFAMPLGPLLAGPWH